MTCLQFDITAEVWLAKSEYLSLVLATGAILGCFSALVGAKPRSSKSFLLLFTAEGDQVPFADGHRPETCNPCIPGLGIVLHFKSLLQHLLGLLFVQDLTINFLSYRLIVGILKLIDSTS